MLSFLVGWRRSSEWSVENDVGLEDFVIFHVGEFDDERCSNSDTYGMYIDERIVGLDLSVVDGCWEALARASLYGVQLERLTRWFHYALIANQRGLSHKAIGKERHPVRFD